MTLSKQIMVTVAINCALCLSYVVANLVITHRISHRTECIEAMLPYAQASLANIVFFVAQTLFLIVALITSGRFDNCSCETHRSDGCFGALDDLPRCLSCCAMTFWCAVFAGAVALIVSGVQALGDALHHSDHCIPSSLHVLTVFSLMHQCAIVLMAMYALISRVLFFTGIIEAPDYATDANTTTTTTTTTTTAQTSARYNYV